MNKQDRITEINEEIAKLKLEKSNLESELMNEAPDFKTKFQIWLDSEDKEYQSYLPREENYPKLRPYIEDWDMDRHRTYDLAEYMEEDFYYAIFISDEEFELADDWIKKRYTEAKRKQIIEVAQEIMENNLGSFTCDW